MIVQDITINKRKHVRRLNAKDTIFEVCKNREISIRAEK